MKLKIIEEKNNPVLQRKELKIEIDFEGGATPKLEELAAEVVKAKGADAGLVEVGNLFSATGRALGSAKVKIWNSAEAREKFKPHKRAEKAGAKPGEEKKEAPTPAEKKKEAPAEAPKEEKKEAPAEEKPAEKPAQPAGEKK